MNILITGAQGQLGRFLIGTLNSYEGQYNILTHTRKTCDLRNVNELFQIFEKDVINLIIHTAAYTNVSKSDSDHTKVFRDNILASVNVMSLGLSKRAKLAYISTDFVFDGTKGNYKTTDKINPQTVYAKTKASIELAMSTYVNSLIIRTSFFGYAFPFDQACRDRYTSKDYLDVIGPQVLSAALSDKTGIVHVGTKRKSFYELAKRRGPDIVGLDCMSNETPEPLGQDYSLDDLYQK